MPKSMSMAIGRAQQLAYGLPLRVGAQHELVCCKHLDVP